MYHNSSSSAISTSLQRILDHSQLKLTIAYYSKVDIAEESSYDNFSPLRGNIGHIDVLILKAPNQLTIQSLEDEKALVWKSKPTEALREACVYYHNDEKLGIYVYSIDYFSEPKHSFYIFKRNKWRSSSQDRFDSMLHDRLMKFKLGPLTTS